MNESAVSDEDLLPALPANGWDEVLGTVYEDRCRPRLAAFLRRERVTGPVYPPVGEIFNAFALTPFERVRVVILGQDPYHGPGQAMGLSFSVRRGVRVPPSLRNIYREIETDLGIAPPSHGDLSAWARRGVLLLNAVLTVREGRAASHHGQGWEVLTDAAVEALNSRRAGLVFMLWGAHAQKKGARIDNRRHLVLSAPHPSPLSAHRGFLGCGHFSRANDYLTARGCDPLDWSLPA